MQSTTSLLRLYRSPSSPDAIFPSNTLVLDVDKGVVKNAQWDESCDTCSSSTCAENSYDFQGLPSGPSDTLSSCRLSPGECGATSGVCDVMVYVALSGTDVDGRVLNSAEARQSLFQRYDTSEVIPLPSK